MLAAPYCIMLFVYIRTLHARVFAHVDRDRFANDALCLLLLRAEPQESRHARRDNQHVSLFVFVSNSMRERCADVAIITISAMRIKSTQMYMRYDADMHVHCLEIGGVCV